MDNKVIFREKEITLVQGSSSLLKEGILPIGRNSRVPTLRERVDPSNYQNELVIDFINSFGDYPVKAGVLSNLESSVNTLMGISKVRIVRERVGGSPRVKQTVTEVSNFLQNITKQEIDFIPYDGGTVSFFTLLGISATGKGTRVSQVIRFLDTKYEGINLYVNSKGRNSAAMIGTYYKEINTIFIGKWVISNKSKLMSWSSWDWFQIISVDENKNAYDIIRTLINEHNIKNIVFEGYVCMLEHGNIKNAFKEYPKTIHACYFEYPHTEEGFKQLQSRVVGRSGKEIKGTCWPQNKGYRKVFECHDENTGIGRMFNFDAPVEVFGELFFSKIDTSKLPEFLEYSKENTTLRHIDSFDESINKFEDIYMKQQSYLNLGTNLQISKYEIIEDKDAEQNVSSEVTE